MKTAYKIATTVAAISLICLLELFYKDSLFENSLEFIPEL